MMNAQLIQGVKAELKQVQADLANALSTVDALRQKSAALQSVVDAYGSEHKAVSDNETGQAALGLPEDDSGWVGLTQAEACYRAVKEAGRPVTRLEIFRIISGKGVRVKNSATLSPTLSNHPKLQHLGGGEWTVK